MPIIALVLSTLAIWLIYWFVRMGGVDHVMGMFVKRSEDARRIISREAERTAPLRAVDDPRDAATILMLVLVRTGGDPTREQIAAIETAIRAVFGFDRELTEHMTQARFIASRPTTSSTLRAFSLISSRNGSRSPRSTSSSPCWRRSRSPPRRRLNPSKG